MSVMLVIIAHHPGVSYDVSTRTAVRSGIRGVSHNQLNEVYTLANEVPFMEMGML